MSNVQVQLGGQLIQAQVQSSGVARASASVLEALAAQAAAEAAEAGALVAQTGAQTAQGLSEDARDGAEGWAALAASATGLLAYATVPFLLADTILSYTAGSGLVVVSTGNVVTADHFRYTVAASAASDQHVTTGGGVKLYVLPDEDGSLNVQAFGAVGSGLVDDSAPVQKALDAGYPVTFQAGKTYELKNIALDGTISESAVGRTIRATGATLQQTINLDGSPMFIISANTATNLLEFNASTIIVNNGGGHVFDFRGNFNHCKIDVTLIRQKSPGKSIIQHSDTSFFFNEVRGLYWAITTSHTVPAIEMSSTSNKITANRFNILRPDRSGSVPFMRLNSSSASDYNYGNKIDLSYPEVCGGGVLEISRASNTDIGMMHCFDMGTITNHVLKIGSAGFPCQNTTVRNYQRNSGTLSSGIMDIMVGDGNYTVIEHATGVSGTTVLQIDLNNEPLAMVLGVNGFVDVLNVPTTGVIIRPSEIILPSATTVTAVSAGAIAAGTSTLIIIDTEAVAATDDLDTISGGINGMTRILRSSVNSRDVTVKDGTGNLALAGDFTLSHREDTITLRYSASLSLWVELSRSDNAA